MDHIRTIAVTVAAFVLIGCSSSVAAEKLKVFILAGQLARATKIDELTGGYNEGNLKKMSHGPEKTKVEAEIARLIEEEKACKKKLSDSCAVPRKIPVPRDSKHHHTP